MHKWGGGAHVHMYTKYQVSMSNPLWQGEVCTGNDDDTNANANDDAQNMIV